VVIHNTTEPTLQRICRVVPRNERRARRIHSYAADTDGCAQGLVLIDGVCRQRVTISAAPNRTRVDSYCLASANASKRVASRAA